MLKFWRWNEKLPPQPVYRPPPPSRQEKSEKGGLWFTVANRVWRPRDFSRNVWKIIWLALVDKREWSITTSCKWGILIVPLSSTNQACSGLYYVNLVYNFNLNAHYHIYKSWTFMISTANLTVASSKAVASLAAVHVPSPLVTSAFSRRRVGLPPHAKKPLVPRANKYLCNNIFSNNC